jgi:hypothetical protein
MKNLTLKDEVAAIRLFGEEQIGAALSELDASRAVRVAFKEMTPRQVAREDEVRTETVRESIYWAYEATRVQ